MTRKEFLELMGITTAVTCLGCSKNPMLLPENENPTIQDLTHGQVYPGVHTDDNRENHTYNSDSNPPPPHPKVDFTINVVLPPNSELQFLGGYVYHKGIIIAKTFQGDFIAASEYCTHNGVTLEYIANLNKFECPAHGSEFDHKGQVLIGPASKNIKTYKTELNGNLLRVFEE